MDAMLNITELNGTRVSVPMTAHKTCSPFFVIHRPYYGYGTWGDKSYRLTHLPSSQQTGLELSGRNARQALRAAAAVLAAQPVDWTSASPDLSGVDDVVRKWMKTFRKMEAV